MDVCCIEPEMILPGVFPWVEESHNARAVGINGSQVCAFMSVTSAARPSQVRHFAPTGMLAGDDVLDVEWPANSSQSGRRQYSHRLVARARTCCRMRGDIKPVSPTPGDGVL